MPTLTVIFFSRRQNSHWNVHFLQNFLGLCTLLASNLWCFERVLFLVTIVFKGFVITKHRRFYCFFSTFSDLFPNFRDVSTGSLLCLFWFSATKWMIISPKGPSFAFFGSVSFFKKVFYMLAKIGKRPKGPLFVFFFGAMHFSEFFSNNWVGLLQIIADTKRFVSIEGFLDFFGTIRLIKDIFWEKGKTKKKFWKSLSTQIPVFRGFLLKKFAFQALRLTSSLRWSFSQYLLE